MQTSIQSAPSQVGGFSRLMRSLIGHRPRTFASQRAVADKWSLAVLPPA